MSYIYFNNRSPLVAVYNSTSQTSNTDIRKMPIDTSLHSGDISNNEVTLDFACHLMGDFYGSTTVNLVIQSCFLIDSVEQFEATDPNKGASSVGSRSPENFFAKANRGQTIATQYKRFTETSYTITTDAVYPRITGVLS